MSGSNSHPMNYIDRILKPESLFSDHLYRSSYSNDVFLSSEILSDRLLAPTDQMWVSTLVTITQDVYLDIFKHILD